MLKEEKFPQLVTCSVKNINQKREIETGRKPVTITKVKMSTLAQIGHLQLTTYLK